jgi:hypothetical protein
VTRRTPPDTPLALALEQTGGPGAGREHGARLGRLLASELQRGEAELALKRSGYGSPVSVAIAATEAQDALRAALPVGPALRADPDALAERGWLLVAATVGALVEAGGEPVIRAGEHDGRLVLETPAREADPELATLAFDEHVAGIDRLRARALAVPAHVLAGAADLRPPLGAAHPLVVAACVAALGGRPAEQASLAEHEEAVLARLEAEAPPGHAVIRPHDDPDPSRRVARRILQRLDGMGKWGGYHTDFAHLARGFAGNDRALADAVGEALLAAGLLAEKPSVGQRHVFLNPRRAGDIRALIERGDLPEGLALPSWPAR